jgi:23S rRNA (pseudouridine1915-N3)-methyltransferase
MRVAMRLIVTAVGRLKAGPERELAERYLARAAKAGKGLGFQAVEVNEIGESRAARPDDRLAEEGAAIARAVEKARKIVVLDPAGQPLPSEALAARLAQWRDGGQAVTNFVIGGADGLSPHLKSSADLLLSFGAATWPHQLVRIMLLEQLYRAVTILSGHPYHRA